MMRNFLIGIFLFFCTASVRAQIDIQARLKVYSDTSLPDTVRALALEDVAWEYLFINTDSHSANKESTSSKERTKDLDSYTAKINQFRKGRGK